MAVGIYLWCFSPKPQILVIGKPSDKPKERDILQYTRSILLKTVKVKKAWEIASQEEP